MIPGLTMEGEWRRGKKKTVPGLALEGGSWKGPVKGQASQETRKTTLTLIIRLGNEFSKETKAMSLTRKKTYKCFKMA